MGYRDEDEAVRARLDAVLAENEALKSELAQRAQPSTQEAPSPPPDPRQNRAAPAPSSPPAPAAAPSRKGTAVVVALLVFVSLPGVVYTARAAFGGLPVAPAIVMDAVALFAVALVLYGRYGPDDPNE